MDAPGKRRSLTRETRVKPLESFNGGDAVNHLVITR